MKSAKETVYTDGKLKYKVMPQFLPGKDYTVKYRVMCRNVEGYELWWKPTEKAGKMHDTKEAAQAYLDSTARKKGWKKTE